MQHASPFVYGPLAGERCRSSTTNSLKRYGGFNTPRGIFHAVNSRQVAVDRLFVHVDLPRELLWREKARRLDQRRLPIGAQDAILPHRAAEPQPNCFVPLTHARGSDGILAACSTAPEGIFPLTLYHCGSQRDFQYFQFALSSDPFHWQRLLGLDLRSGLAAAAATRDRLVRRFSRRAARNLHGRDVPRQ